MKKILVFVFTFLMCLSSIQLEGKSGEKNQVSTEINIYTQRLNNIEKQFTSKKDIELDQFNIYREEVLDTINALNDLQNRLNQTIQRSVGDSREFYEQQLKIVNETINRAQMQLRIIDKEKIHVKAMHYLLISHPLYDKEVIKKAFDGALSATTGLFFDILDSIKNVFISIYTPPYSYYWILWLFFSILLTPFVILSKRKWGHKEEKITLINKIRAFIVCLFAEAIFPLIVIGAFLLISHSENSLKFAFMHVVAFYLAIAFIWISVRVTYLLIYPRHFEWSLIHISKERSGNLARRISLFSIFLAIRLWLDYINDPIEFTQVLEFVAQILLSIQAFVILRVTNWSRISKGLIMVLAVIAPICIFIGLNSLADLILDATVLTVMIYLVLKGLHYLIKRSLFFLFKNPKSILIHHDPESDKSSELMLYWSNTIFGIILFLVGVYSVLIVWGIDQSFLNDWVSRLLFGFRIGTHTFSLVNVLFAILVFLFFFSLTRYVQSVLANHVFPYTRFDSGLKHALKTTTGYIGFAITVIITIKTIGLDLSSVLFVVGGLSVGIGLGLQPIVTNFISGLIMLLERPIKIGDCIELGGEMGTVKRINVRTTEIETFEKCSVLFPNSQVINATVKNWTKNNLMRRVEVIVGVDYKTDPKRIEEILLNCAKNEPLFLKEPGPYVFFKDFGEHSLTFSVRGYIGNIDDVLKVQTSIRNSIYEALKNSDINIPFPQSDIHFDSEFIEAIRKG